MKTYQNKVSSGWRFFLPLGTMIAIWLFDDFFFPHARLTPLLSAIALSVLAFYIRPRDMAFWSLIFFICVSFRLYTDALANSWQADDITPYLRIMGFAVFGVITTIICFYRVRLEGHASDILGILAKLPIPVLISNESGTIIFTNEQTANLLEMKTQDLIGQSYFSLLIHPDNQGRTIARYIEIVDSAGTEDVSIPLKVRGRDDLEVSGNLARVELSGNKALITVLDVKVK